MTVPEQKEDLSNQSDVSMNSTNPATTYNESKFTQTNNKENLVELFIFLKISVRRNLNFLLTCEKSPDSRSVFLRTVIRKLSFDAELALGIKETNAVMDIDAKLTFLAEEPGAVPVQTTGLQLTITPASIVTGENNSVNLRCLLSNPPKANASVYVIWRFRHSSKPPPPTNWAFMHQEDDLVRCPDPPKNCEFVNQQRALQFFRETHAQLNRPANYLEEKGLIESRQLHTLHLHNVSKHCDGIFQCYILINLDAIEKRVEFHVWSPPTEPVGVYFIKETLPSGSVQAPLNLTSAHLGRITHQLIAGKKYYLSCVVSGANPRPLVRWAVKDHRTGRERVLQTGNFSSVTQSSWLPFSKYLDVQTTTNLSYQDDDGLLHCQVENSVGKMRSESVKLSLLYAPVINPFEKAIKRVLELAAIQQSCQAFGKPPASIKWIDKQGLLVSNSSDLHLPGITRNGVKDFICTASNYIGETRREITFDVLYPPQVFIPPSVMANEGERLEIACRADSNPPVRRIYWTVNSSASLGRSESSARYNSRTLVIPNVSQRNFGEYTCHAESVKNLAEILDEQEMEGLSKDRVEWWLTGYRSSATLTLSVHYHPGQTTLLVSPSDKVNEEETVMFRCLENSTSPGYPRPTIYWFKLNLAQIPHSLFHSVDWWSVPIQPVQTNSTSYVVHRAQMLDSGIYGCYPKNAMGEGRPSHTFLSVAGKPIIISSSPEMNFVEITDLKTFAPDESYHPKTALAGSTSPRSAPRVSLNCTLLGSSDMTVTWYYSPSDTKVSLGNEYKINMDDYNSASPRSPTEHYISQNSSKVTNLDITYVSSTLAIPFLHSYDVPTPLLRNWMQDPFLKCDPKSMPDYIDWTGETSFHIWRQLKQLQQADGLYRCEASSHLGNTSHTMRIRVQ
ncbi:Carcinoembryonic antigen- cell adhesion molecule 5, partial [Clonorchis sinensis]